MLVLSRKIGDKILIGDTITIVVNRVSHNRIALAIDAPADVRIVRGELAEAAESEANSQVRNAGGQARGNSPRESECEMPNSCLGGG